MLKAAVMIVINQDGYILGISRKDDPSKFGLCGGKLEKNETPIQAAIRETFEETGIVVNECTFVYERVEPRGTPEGLDFNSYCFYATKWSGEPRSSDEGNVKWCTKDDLLGKNGAFPQYNKKALEILSLAFPHLVLR